jgi:hypothetical protein
MPTVELRAFRGTQRSSTYRQHALAITDFIRIRDTARSIGLPVIGSLDPHRVDRLDKEAAWRVAEEATRLRLGSKLLDLDDHIAAIASLARWCAQPGGAWLTIATI